MKILLISFEFPPQPGGIGTYSYQIAKNLCNYHHEIIALVNTNLIPLDIVVEFDKKQQFKIFRFKNYKNKVLKIIHRIWFSFKIINNSKYDLLFIPYSHAGIIGLFAKAVFNIPYVMMGHGSEFLYKNKLLRFLIRLFFNNANLILTNSQFTANLIYRMGIYNPHVKIIPLGADDQLFKRDNYDGLHLKRKYGFENKDVLLTVGNLSIRKGHRTVIDAVEILKMEFPNILYLIVGRGKQYENLKKIIKDKNLTEFVILAGFISQELLPEYFAFSSVFILNSTIASDGDVEGFGIVVLEAALMGKPSIGTLDCGMEEVIEDGITGLLVPMDNPQMTARAIKKMIGNRELMKTMGKSAYRRAKLHFTWEDSAYKTDQIFRSYFDLK